MLTAEALGRRFGDRWIFRGISLEAGKGQVIAVTGPNGQGKSTLLKVLSGLIEASEGTCSHTGSIGWCAIDSSLYPSLTAREHIDLAQTLQGGSKTAQQILDSVGLGHAIDKQADQMSTGMKVRLKLALAVQHEPKILFLDEPTAALDEEGRKTVAAIVAAQKERGATLIATNDQADLEMATHELLLA